MIYEQLHVYSGIMNAYTDIFTTGAAVPCGVSPIQKHWLEHLYTPRGATVCTHHTVSFFQILEVYSYIYMCTMQTTVHCCSRLRGFPLPRGFWEGSPIILFLKVLA